jgi:starch synthase
MGNIYVPLGWRNQYCGIFTYEQDGVTFYFVDNEYYFKRPGCYGYYDDGERFAFFFMPGERR